MNEAAPNDRTKDDEASEREEDEKTTTRRLRGEKRIVRCDDMALNFIVLLSYHLLALSSGRMTPNKILIGQMRNSEPMAALLFPIQVFPWPHEQARPSYNRIILKKQFAVPFR